MSDSRAMFSRPTSSEPSHRARCGWFWAWTAVGVTAALGLISLGPIALVPAASVGTVMASRDNSRRSLWGLLAGAGLLSLFVAYIQRNGPGTTCWHTATASGCDQHLNPIPWLTVGVLLTVGALVGQARRRDEATRDRYG